MTAGIERDEDGRWWRRGRRGKRIRIGNQLPTFERTGEWAYTDGPDAREVFEGWGVGFYESQAHELDVYLARNADNSFASRTICISKPRQNGKSYAARNYAVWMAAACGARVLYSAHDGKTTSKMFREIKNLVLGVEEIYGELDPSFGKHGVYSSPGKQSVRFRNGGCIDFNTRTNSAARGDTYQIIIIDEAQELTYLQLDAMNPTTLAASDVEEEGRDPQKILLGTPPGPACLGEVFRDYHDQAHAGGSTGIWWLEWSVDKVPDLTDYDAVMELAYECNPALGYRIREDVMASAIEDYQARPDSFAREYLNWWSPVARETAPIGRQLWERTAIDAIGKDYPVKTALAVKFSPDGSAYALAGCKLDRKGNAAVELVEIGTTANGTKALAAALMQRRNSTAVVVVDGLAGAAALCDNIAELNPPKGYVVRPRTGEVIAAATGMVDALNDGSVAHTRQAALDDSALNATRRAIGKNGGWGFGSKENHDSSAIEAVSLALWGARTTKRNPARKQVLL